MSPALLRRDADRLRALAADAAARFDGLDGTDPLAQANAVLAWAATTFPGSVAVACSMADAVLPHLVATHIPGVDVLFLDTGYHFEETRRTRDRVAAELDVRIVTVRPELSIADQDARFGPQLYASDPGRCCALRKMEPLAGALAGYDAWVTGVRREEAPTRTDTPLVTFDAAHGLVKLNPLAGWSFDELLAYAQEHEVPVNPLLTQGYPSIGCAPCTRPVAPGADPRSGRWAGFAKTECGIHR